MIDRSKACTKNVLLEISTVTVPGVRVIELAYNVIFVSFS